MNFGASLRPAPIPVQAQLRLETPVVEICMSLKATIWRRHSVPRRADALPGSSGDVEWHPLNRAWKRSRLFEYSFWIIYIYGIQTSPEAEWSIESPPVLCCHGTVSGRIASCFRWSAARRPSAAARGVRPSRATFLSPGRLSPWPWCISLRRLRPPHRRGTLSPGRAFRVARALLFALGRSALAVASLPKPQVIRAMYELTNLPARRARGGCAPGLQCPFTYRCAARSVTAPIAPARRPALCR